MPPSAPNPVRSSGTHLEVGAPGRGFGSVGDDQRGSAEGLEQRVGDAVEDPSPTHHLEALGPALEAGSTTAGEDDTAHGQ